MIRAARALLAGLLAICVWIGPAEVHASPPAAALLSETPPPLPTESPDRRIKATEPAYLLKHYPPRHPGNRPALLLVPGIGFNGNLYDISSRISLARWLSDRGYPVWIFEPRWEVLEAQEPAHLSLPYLIDHVLADAIEEIHREATGRNLILIGHSTGGTLIAGYLEHQPDAAVTGAILIAPVLSLRFPDRVLRELPPVTISKAAGSDLLPDAWLDAPVAFLKDESYFGLLLTNHRPGNRKELRAAIVPALAPIPSPIASQLQHWISGGCCAVGDQDYYRDLPRIKVPVLLISGIADNIARREDVERAGLSIGSRDREYRMMSRTNFYREDYGHLDLIATPEATREVYPHVLRWLKGKRARRAFPTR